MLKEWASRSFSSRTYHLLQADGYTTVCGVGLPDRHMVDISRIHHVPKGARRCTNCAYHL